MPIAESKEHRISAPIANAMTPIKLVNSDNPTIFRAIFQSFLRYSSLYLKIIDRKNPSNNPIVRNAEVLPIHSVDKSGRPSLAV